MKKSLLLQGDLDILLKKCVAGNTAYQKLFYERYYSYAFKICFRYIRQYERVAEVVDDAFFKLFRTMGRFVKSSITREPELEAWIKKTVVIVAIQESQHDKFLPGTSDFSLHAPKVTAGMHDITERLFYKELIRLIKNLPPRYCIVFNMYVIDGFSHEEITQELHITVDTCKSNLDKARDCLRTMLNKEVPAKMLELV